MTRITEDTQEMVEPEFDDGAGVAYTIAKLREELDELYRRETPQGEPKVRPGKLLDVGMSVISRLQHIDHLQRYQIACLERGLALALNPPRHKFWGAGERDCPRDIKAGNGELHTLRCKVCGEDDPRDDRCLAKTGEPFEASQLAGVVGERDALQTALAETHNERAALREALRLARQYVLVHGHVDDLAQIDAVLSAPSETAKGEVL